MITLITGTPGAGKSLYTVSELLRKQYAGRRLCVSGIPDLVLDHEPLTDDQAANWHVHLRPEDVLVVDEAQRLWRPRGSGASTPPGVAAMEVHRSGHSVDIVLITQHPGLLDANIRKLVGRHIHLRNVWGMSRALTYEWSEATDPARTRNAQVKPWAYPKDAFKLYKSAQVHTKRGQRPPLIFFGVVLLVLSLPFLGWFVVNKYSSGPMSSVVAASGLPGSSAPGVPGQAVPIKVVDGTVELAGAGASAYAPSQPQPAQLPAISGCYRGSGRCVCLDERGNSAGVDDQFCAEWMAGLHHDRAPVARPASYFVDQIELRPQPQQPAPPAREGGGVSLAS